jgi:hypothetical protein
MMIKFLLFLTMLLVVMFYRCQSSVPLESIVEKALANRSVNLPKENLDPSSRHLRSIEKHRNSYIDPCGVDAALTKKCNVGNTPNSIIDDCYKCILNKCDSLALMRDVTCKEMQSCIFDAPCNYRLFPILRQLS